MKAEANDEEGLLPSPMTDEVDTLATPRPYSSWSFEGRACSNLLQSAAGVAELADARDLYCVSGVSSTLTTGTSISCVRSKAEELQQLRSMGAS